MLVRLVAPGRIAAISHYSHDPAATSLPLAVARRFRATAGTAEEVIALRPALVLASTFTPPATRDAYARAGLRTMYLDSPTTIAASIAQVGEVARAVGERGRGEVMVGGIERSLELNSPPACGRGTFFSPPASGRGAFFSPPASGRGWGRACPPAIPNIPSPNPSRKREGSALLYIAGDLATGSGTLLDELLRRAGFRNAAADYGLAYTGRIPLERLVAHPPAIIIAPDGMGSGGGRTAALRHRLLPDVPQTTFPRALINCGGPAIVPALARLRAIRATLP